MDDQSGLTTTEHTQAQAPLLVSAFLPSDPEVDLGGPTASQYNQQEACSVKDDHSSRELKGQNRTARAAVPSCQCVRTVARQRISFPERSRNCHDGIRESQRHSRNKWQPMKVPVSVSRQMACHLAFELTELIRMNQETLLSTSVVSATHRHLK